MNSFYRKNTLFIKYFVAFVFIIFTMLIVYNSRSRALEIEEKYTLFPFLKVITYNLNLDLSGKCETFINNQTINKIKPYTNRNNIDFNISKVEVVQIDDLLFERIDLIVFKKIKTSIFLKSRGYIVTNVKNRKCFGLI